MITIEVKGLDKLNLNKAPSIIKNKVTESIRRSVVVTKQNIARKAPVFEGTLKKSVDYKVMKMRGEIGISQAASKYGYVQEYGRKPGSIPPVSALKRWARIKLGNEGAAYPVARSIARKGTKPQPFFEPGVKDSLPQIERFLADAGSKIIANL